MTKIHSVHSVLKDNIDVPKLSTLLDIKAYGRTKSTNSGIEKMKNLRILKCCSRIYLEFLMAFIIATRNVAN